MRLVQFVLLAGLCGTLCAEVTLPAIFGDHMVLQRGATLPIWGAASPGEQVKVYLAGEFAQTKADSAGYWRVMLRPLPADDVPVTLVVDGKNHLEIQDVLLGDVWICAGEGNMSLPLSEAVGGKDTPEKMSDDALRFFVADQKPSLTPDHQGAGHWSVCTPESVNSFSAVGYFFARDLRSSHHFPMGMIQCTDDDAPAQAWISRGGLSTKPAFSTYLAELAGVRKSQGDNILSQKTPSSLFNGMIAPLIPYAMTGVIWYQGESNEGQPALEYRRLFPRLIRDWRTQWKQGPFPFFYVQVAGFGEEDGPAEEPFYAENHEARRGLPWLREGSASALMLPNTGMAVTSDLGAPDDHQPPDKLDVGRRLALLARKQVYGEEIVDSGPIYRGMQIEGAKVRVFFDSVGGGLTLGSSPFHSEDTESPTNSDSVSGDTHQAAETNSEVLGTGTSESQTNAADADSSSESATIPSLGFAVRLKGFALAGANGKWFPATGQIEGSTVLLTSDAVPYPSAVRYNWTGFPLGNLYNKEGLPAAPFRSDGFQPDAAK